MADEYTPRENAPNNEPAFCHFNWRDGVYSWDLNLTDPILSEIPYTPTEQAPLPAKPLPALQSAQKQELSAEQASVKEYRPRKKKRRSTPELLLGTLIYMACVLCVSFGLATVSWNWANDLLALNKPPKAVSVTISDTQTVEQVADSLKANGLINYKYLFNTFAAVTGKGERITAGTYDLNTEMDYSALLNSMSSTSKVRETVTVTIPEGYTVAEAFQLLSNSGVCSLEQLNSAAESVNFDYDFLSNDRKGVARLEGYLFPDTYEFYKGAQATSVISRMLSNFETRIDKDILALQKESGYTLDEIIIMASIIEKESTGTDRERISSVIHNRLANPDHDNINGCLQMDSTVQYILPERKEHLTDEDISIDSPYNTYVVQGLPVAPICNAGLSSIQAALQPEKTDYYYFMLGNDGDDHFFSDASSFYQFKAATQAE